MSFHPNSGSSNKARTAAMTEMYRAGRTLQEIGETFHISRERVRQCLTAAGIRGKDGGVFKRACDREAARLSMLDERSLRRRGMTFAEFKALPRKATSAFLRQKANAECRGIAWDMNLAQWWDIWQKSGKWEQRGRGQGYCMGRKGDCGPYAPWNVYICTGSQNCSDSYLFKPYHARNHKNSMQMIEYRGRRYSMLQLAREVGINATTIKARIDRGWPLEKAVTAPVIMTNTRRAALSGQVA